MDKCHIPSAEKRLWWAITLELSEKSILQAEIGLQEAKLIAELKGETDKGGQWIN